MACPSRKGRVGLYATSPRTSLWSGFGLFATIPHAQKSKNQLQKSTLKIKIKQTYMPYMLKKDSL